jgi:hypothetical protein
LLWLRLVLLLLSGGWCRRGVIEEGLERAAGREEVAEGALSRKLRRAGWRRGEKRSLKSRQRRRVRRVARKRGWQ